MQKKREISLVILDLDNTLWDWVEIWYQSFSAMFDEVLKKSSLDKDLLLKEVKAIFESKGTTEYSFVLGEMPSLLKKYGSTDSILKNLDSAIWAHRKARYKYSKLYSKVQSTLKSIKDKGCLIAAYTESMKFYTDRRLITFGLDGLIDYIYYNKNHRIPKGTNIIYPDDKYELTSTKSIEIDNNIEKPSPQILNKIITDLNVDKNRVIYVGDNLYKDVLMAKKAGIIDVWAKYGSRVNNKKAYELLRKVTHWNKKEVEKEKEIYATEEIIPSYTLKKTIKELNRYFKFVRPANKVKFSKDRNIKIEYYLEVWKKVIDVQMHFNEIEMRIRNLALTILTAVITSTVIVLKTDSNIPAWTLPLGGILGIFAFFVMDYYWYHRLLYGAVEQGLFIEDSLKSFFPEMSLTTKIKDESPLYIPLYIKTVKIGSKQKLLIFYGVALLILILLLIFCIISDNPDGRLLIKA